MNRTTVAVDLAKSVFQLAVADASWMVVQTHRLTHTSFERWFYAFRKASQRSHVHRGLWNATMRMSRSQNNSPQ